MVHDVAIIEMGTNKSFIHLIKCFKGRNFGRCLINPIFFLAYIIFSLRCFSKVRPELSKDLNVFVRLLLLEHFHSIIVEDGLHLGFSKAWWVSFTRYNSWFVVESPGRLFSTVKIIEDNCFKTFTTN